MREYKLSLRKAAMRYHEQGWVTIPVRYQGKEPEHAGWQKQTLQAFKGQDFLREINIGIVLGNASGGLVDIDLDCSEARQIAARFLPETDCVFGRVGNPSSHWLYNVADCGSSKQFSCEDMIVEYRANGGHTVFPPSIHATGEGIQFVKDGTPNSVPREELIECVSKLAAASLMAKHWHRGQRHNTALALTGTLLNAGWDKDEIAHFVESVCIAAQDEEISDRLSCVETTQERERAGQSYTAAPSLSNLIGDKANAKLKEWLKIPTTAVIPYRSQLPSADRPLLSIGTPHVIGLHFNDANLSDVFASQYANQARFCHAENEWVYWDGKRWRLDKAKHIVNLAKDCVRFCFVKAAQSPAEASQIRQASYSLNAGRIRGVIELAKSSMSIDKSELDADSWLFNCNNGIINLKNGLLSQHDPVQMQSCLSPVTFDPNAECPLFLAFLSQIMLGNQGMMDFMQRAVGYTLTGDTTEQCLFLLTGDGRNGKSTFLELLRFILGDYAHPVAAKTLMVSNRDDIPSDVAALEGKRFAACSETNAKQTFNEGRIKLMTGGEMIEGRRRYADEVSFMPKFKLWIATNALPVITGTDEGIWRRIRLIRFDLKLHQHEVDRQLLSKLKCEASGVLNWMLEGCLAWQKQGLNPPEEVLSATQSYRADMDYVEQFIQDCIEMDPNSRVDNTDFYNAFKDWYYQNVDNYPPSQKVLTPLLKDKGLLQKSGKKRVWQGVKFKDLDHLVL